MKDQFMSDEMDEEFNLRAFLENYLIHWKWFALGVIFCYSIAYFYLRYSTPQYQASTTILVKDDKKGGVLSELSAFSDLGLGNGMKSNVDNEIEILKSRSVVESTVKKLKLNVSFVIKGRVNDLEIYKNAPILVDFVNVTPSFYNEAFSLEFTKLSFNTFKLSENPKGLSKIIINNKKDFKFGEIIQTKVGGLVITKNLDIESTNNFDDSSSIYILLNPLDNVAGSFKGRLDVAPISKTSSVVALSLKDTQLERAQDFLNTLIQIYNEDAAADKNFISENTSKFIRERLILITKELDGVEQDVESFKRSNNLTDIESEAKLFIEGSSDYNSQSLESEIQLNVVTSMLDFLKKSTNADLLPANMISVKGQGEAAELISNYNELVLKRNRILKSATIANPTVILLDQEISSVKLSVKQSLSRMLSNLNIQQRNLKGQESLFNSKIGKIPVQERQFRSIARQQKVKEELYLYLLQKREETAIALSATAPNARVIDEAKGGSSPVSPNPRLIFLSAIMIGLLIPFSILYLINLLDTKVKSRLTITDKFNIPFLGDVPRSLTPNEIIDTKNRTSTAEAIRIVKANLDYMLAQVPETKARSIFVTSTIPGEGKTFLSVNLASIFAHSGKKVILVGLDIRKPKLNEYVGIKSSIGLTDYLSSSDSKATNFINKMPDFEAFDVLLGGSIRPNPTELLMSEKVDLLFAQLKEDYDYIIVDTAPVSLVSDTLIVAKHADTFAYVVRANYLDKRLLNIAGNLYKDQKLPNMAFILNDTAISKGYGYGGYGYGGYGYSAYGYGGYGYGGYGYGVDIEKEKMNPWYIRIFSKLRK